MKKLGLFLLIGILAFSSCKKDEDDPIPTVSTVTENITTNTTWTTGSVYIIDGTLYIDGATLTIEPGTIIKFTEGSQIEVGSSASGSAIVALGTAAEPILFTSNAASPAPGDWDAVFFESGTATTTNMQFCIFEYGGGYANYAGTVDLDDAEITMDNCTIRHSENYGVSLDVNSSFGSFANNTIGTCGTHPIRIYPNAVHTIGSGNTITATASLGIHVKDGNYDQADATWLAQTCPYVIDGTMSIEKNAGTILNIQAGAVIAFTQGSQIEVGYSSNTYGTIKANGTASNPILFTSAAVNKTAGDWDAIFLSDGTSSSSVFEHCNFEYGGGYAGYCGMVDLDGCSATFTDCSFIHSENYGITLNSEAYFESFENNAFANNANHVIKIYGNWAHTIGTGNSYTTSLGILVSDDVFEHTDETWLKQDCPYYIDGTLAIESATGAILNIEAGTHVYFTSGSQIEVGYGSGTYGKLVAQGTASERIIFSSGAPAGSQTAGDWDAIFFEDGTSNGSILDYCDISYGGGYASYSGNVQLDATGTAVTISNCNITDSENHGISVGSSDNPTILNVTYSNIAGNDYHVR